MSGARWEPGYALNDKESDEDIKVLQVRLRNKNAPILRAVA